MDIEWEIRTYVWYTPTDGGFSTVHSHSLFRPLSLSRSLPLPLPLSCFCWAPNMCSHMYVKTMMMWVCVSVGSQERIFGVTTSRVFCGQAKCNKIEAIFKQSYVGTYQHPPPSHPHFSVKISHLECVCEHEEMPSSKNGKNKINTLKMSATTKRYLLELIISTMYRYNLNGCGYITKTFGTHLVLGISPIYRYN